MTTEQLAKHIKIEKLPGADLFSSRIRASLHLIVELEVAKEFEDSLIVKEAAIDKLLAILYEDQRKDLRDALFEFLRTYPYDMNEVMKAKDRLMAAAKYQNQLENNTMKTILVRKSARHEGLVPKLKEDIDIIRHIISARPDRIPVIDAKHFGLAQRLAELHGVIFEINTGVVWCEHMDDIQNEFGYLFCPACGKAKPEGALL